MTKTLTVAFTGHRTYQGSADAALEATIRALYLDGARHFRVGMAEGFDLAAGLILVRLSEELAGITLEAYIPWPRFAERFYGPKRHDYDAILKHAHIIRYAAQQYHRSVFHLRNDMLVEGADYTVAWWDGSQSGTGYTVKRARSNGSKVINLHPQPQLSMGF